MKCLCAFPLLLLILCGATLAVAQSTNATISGVVVDAAGKIIPGAEIEIVNDATGVHYSSETNGTGIYSVAILPPGEYRLQVSKVGFKTLIKPGVVLNVQSALALNFTLPVGATSESITVEAGSQEINTTDGSVSTVIDRKFVENIPLNGRSLQDLISITPGVVTQSPQSNSYSGANGDFSINGQRTESNYYTVDGVSANTSAGAGSAVPSAANAGAVPASTALGTTQSIVSVDALQEFRVESSTYSAEYGHSPGGQFAFVTRSGTNDLHGSVFDYLRNNFFDANDWFNDHYGQPISALIQNDFGGTVGGPIVLPHLYRGKDHTFFFVSYEGLRLIQPQPATVQYVPDSALRVNGPISLRPILNAFPIANGIDFDNGFAEFIKAYSLPGSIDSTSVRLDHRLNPRTELFFRYSDTPTSSDTRNLSVLNQSTVNTHTYTAGVTSQLSNKTTNEFRVGYAGSASQLHGSLDSFGGAVPIDLAEAMGLGASKTSSPYFDIYIDGTGNDFLTYTNAETSQRQWNATDTVHLEVGRHTLALGVDYRRLVSPLNPPTPSVLTEYFSEQSVLTNNADLSYIYKYLNATPIFNELALFAQDTWHIQPRLNLSLGLRWELDPPLGAVDGNVPYTLLGSVSNPSTLTLAPQGTALWKTTYYNFAPRLGIAWRAREDGLWDTVVRAGGGVFFDTDNRESTQGYAGIGFSNSREAATGALPLTTEDLDFSVSPAPPYTNDVVFAFPQHLQLPYTLEWNVALEQMLDKEQTLTLSYIGANGRRLLQTQEFNITALNPGFGYIYVFPNGLTSNYQALQVQFTRSLHRGLQAIASYTWSHSLDFGSTDAALLLRRGNSNFDVRSNFVGGISWDLPCGQGGNLIKLATCNWGLDGRLMARTAFPVTLSGDLLTDPATGSQYYSGLDLVAGQPLFLHGSQYPGGRAINAAAFALPVGDESGSAPRNFVRGFGASQVNLAARREFHLHDNLALQFRAETFNLTNHPNFGFINPSIGDQMFGQATKMLNQSLGTMASQYQQGGPRSMQFALKVLF